MAQLIYGTTDRTQGVLNYTVSENASQVTISASSDLQAKSYYQSGYQITTSVGSKSTSAEDYIKYLYGSFTTAFSTGTVSETYTKNYSPYTVTVSSSYTGKNVSGYLAGSKSGSTSVTITIPAKASYTVSYNANGGSGAPGAQTKWYGETLTLSSTRPSRTGYSFVGWGTSSGDTSVNYNPGGNYTSNASITLYAIWSANTYTVSYNANGGSGAPGNQTKTYGVTLTLSSTRPTRAYYNFLGWSTSSSATTAQYSAGGSFTTNANTTLYAVWQLAYTKPSITNVNVYRANSSGTASDEGTYITYKFNWSIFPSASLQNVKLQYKLTTASSWTTGTTLTPSGKSGTINTTVGGGLVDITKTYDVRIVVTDTRDYSQYYTIVATSSAIIDIDAQNNGVAIGKFSEVANTLEIGLNVAFSDPAQARTALEAVASGYGFGEKAVSLGTFETEADVVTKLDELFTGLASLETKLFTYSLSNARYFGIMSKIASANGIALMYTSTRRGALFLRVKSSSNSWGVKSIFEYDVVPIEAGGTEATTAEQARTNLGAVSKTGDTLSGTYTINSNGTSLLHEGTQGSMFMTVNNTATKAKVSLGVGSAGTNHGVYTNTLGKWLIYASDSEVCSNADTFSAFAWKKASVAFSNHIGSMSASGVKTTSVIVATRSGSETVSSSGVAPGLSAAECISDGTIKFAHDGFTGNASTNWTVSAWWSK